MANYSIDDGDGNRLTAGLQEHRADIVAQRMANDLGEPVYLYEDNPGSAPGEYKEFKPQAKRSEEQKGG